MTKQAEKAGPAPVSYEDLEQVITERYDTLSGQLQRIAHFVIDHPKELALETITTLAQRAEVQPSSIVRFAQALGFDGFSTMQQVFRTRLIESSPSYRERIKTLRTQRGADVTGLSAILSDFAEQGIASLEVLRSETSSEALTQAVDLLSRAEEIYLVAQRRSFPVVFYLSYALARLERRCHLVDGVGGLLREQISLATPDDAIVAVSFRSYAPDVIAAVAEMRAKGVPVVAITDSPLSPLAGLAEVCFEVKDNDSRAFRSLVAPMCLAQSLVVGLGHHLDARASGRGKRKRRG